MFPLAFAMEENYTGEYYEAENRPDLQIDCKIDQTGGIARIIYKISFKDGHGAVVMGKGEGEIDATATLKFTFRDNFSNKGRGIFVQYNSKYTLSMQITFLKNTESLPLYTEHRLYKKEPGAKN